MAERSNEKQRAIMKKLMPLSPIYQARPVLRKQIIQQNLTNAPIELLQEACRVNNTNIVGLMELLGV